MSFVYLPVVLAVGLLLDWALYSRLITTLCKPAFYGRTEGYAELIFPRVIVTIAAIALMFFSQTGLNLNMPQFICGVVIFVGSIAFGVFRFMRHN